MELINVSKEGYEQFLEKKKEAEAKRTSNLKDLSSSCNDYVGDGWHDNPLYDDAMIKSRIHDYEVSKFLKQEKMLNVIDDVFDEKLVNIGDIVEVEFMYHDGKKEKEIIKVTGMYSPNLNSEILEITLNSPIGKCLYKAKIGGTYSYNEGGKKLKIKVVKRI